MIKIIKKIAIISIFFIYRIIRFFSVIWATKFIHLVILRKGFNYKNPTTMNDKMQWLNLRYRNPLMIDCADKYKVREYIKKCGYEHTLNELYDVYNSVDEIDWSKLPEKFAMKCNHGCGFNIICKDKNKLDIKKSKKLLNKWLNINYGNYYNEWQYKNIQRKIICEKYIEGPDGKLPLDYKIYCFNGCPKMLLITKDRELKVKYGLFDLNYKYLPYLNPKDDISHEIKEVDRPKHLEEMIKCAEKLSKPFPYVRVDFYENEDKIIFGEMTFTTSACLYKYNKNYAKELGNDLDIKNLNQDYII